MYIENNGQLVSWGGSTEERRQGRTPIAESHATIKVKDEITMSRCLTALEESDSRLAMPSMNGRPANYDWTIVYKDAADDGSGNIHFGVVWYDQDYYEAHRDTFKGRFHGHLFAQLGISADDFSVSHWNREYAAV